MSRAGECLRHAIARFVAGFFCDVPNDAIPVRAACNQILRPTRTDHLESWGGTRRGLGGKGVLRKLHPAGTDPICLCSRKPSEVATCEAASAARTHSQGYTPSSFTHFYALHNVE